VPFSRRDQCPGSAVVIVGPGLLGIDVGVDRVGDGGVGAACHVLVDHRGTFAVVPHPGHEIFEARAAGRCLDSRSTIERT
jgi:hypothetical protein